MPGRNDIVFLLSWKYDCAVKLDWVGEYEVIGVLNEQLSKSYM